MPDPAPQAAGAGMMSVPEVLAGDTVPPPAPYFDEGDPDEAACKPFSKQSMVCPDYARSETEHLWRRVWQMACRERALPNVGDYLTYEILDQSVIIVRTGEDEFSAFHNVCQHRALKLVEGSGSLGEGGQFTCAFHGWCYDRAGKLRSLPRAWDFPNVDAGKVTLPPVRIDRWDGWIFINFNPAAAPLSDFLGDMLPRHFSLWPQAERHIVSHAMRLVRCNWKAALEAFLEVYHVPATHPSAGKFASDIATKYDVFGPHGRMHMVKFFTPKGVSEQELVDHWIGMGLAAGSDQIPRVPEGGRARGVLAEYQRKQYAARTGRDFGGFSDAEMLDTLEYHVFPNFAPWGGFGTNLVYRVRPNGFDPHSCLFEVMVTAPDPAGERPRDAELAIVPEDASWMVAPGMSGLGTVLDEDVANLERVQKGLQSDGYQQMHFSRYQERLIRNLHDHVDAYIAKGAASLSPAKPAP
jgi:phenylpropionate dioxygenase-like ring-hydroxylating dioxygenase large terminal subunit